MKDMRWRTKFWIRKSRFRKTSLKKSQIAEFSLSLAQLIVKDDLELAEYHKKGLDFCLWMKKDLSTNIKFHEGNPELVLLLSLLGYLDWVRLEF
jgi:hypothetical protein